MMKSKRNNIDLDFFLKKEKQIFKKLQLFDKKNFDVKSFYLFYSAKYLITLHILERLHVPPLTTKLKSEWQLITFIRLYHIIKFLREHHPMRYNRMTEILKTVASIKLSSTFLLKVRSNIYLPRYKTISSNYS